MSSFEFNSFQELVNIKITGIVPLGGAWAR